MKTLKIVSAIAIALGLAAPVHAASWDMATPYPDSEFHTENIRQFADEVKEATGGELETTGISRRQQPQRNCSGRRVAEGGRDCRPTFSAP